MTNTITFTEKPFFTDADDESGTVAGSVPRGPLTETALDTLFAELDAKYAANI